MIYLIYYYFISFILRIFGFFVKVDENKILFVVYGGQRFDDSPRVIYEHLKKQSSNFKYIWAFKDPEDFKKYLPNQEMVRIDSVSYFYHALSSRYWITNSSASRGLNFLKKETKNMMFTHGMTGIKHTGSDINDETTQYNRNIYKERQDLVFLEGNSKEVNILAKAWDLPRKVFRNVGLPRNDELFKISQEKIMSLRKKLNIPNGKKVILYAPTFRDYIKDEKNSVTLNPPINFEYWEKRLGSEYVLLFTAHYEIANLIDIPKTDFVINAFKYPQINDLLIVSDLIISDYSSVFFDFSLLEKPMFSFAFDFDEYSERRGLYDGYEQLFPDGVHRGEESLITSILNMNYEDACRYTKENVKYKYFEHFDPSVERCIKNIFEEL